MIKETLPTFACIDETTRRLRQISWRCNILLTWSFLKHAGIEKTSDEIKELRLLFTFIFL